jgi:hypothetical protein
MSEWIKTADRLPTEEEYISCERFLVIWVNEHGDRIVDMAEYDRARKGWLYGNNEDDTDYPVTHWMPLPEPPK